jgi:hypothetical protein
MADFTYRWISSPDIEAYSFDVVSQTIFCLRFMHYINYIVIFDINFVKKMESFILKFLSVLYHQELRYLDDVTDEVVHMC